MLIQQRATWRFLSGFLLGVVLLVVTSQISVAEDQFPDLTLADVDQIVHKKNGTDGKTYSLNMQLFDQKSKAAWRRALTYPPTFVNDEERKETIQLVKWLIGIVDSNPQTFESSIGLAVRAANHYRVAVNLDIPDVQQQIAKAKRYYELALKMRPADASLQEDDASLQELYGSFLCSISECQDGLPHLEQARTLGSTVALYDLGLAYLESDVPKATEYLTEYRARNPSDQRIEAVLKAIRGGVKIESRHEGPR